ncbi:hypothetical protein ACERK3_16440 [Phycisphaerales bacterium AB-hyl4]|uniref:Uncharacterized protein n=1 Tax=Natronomicrosphaera hydrolytica TaxID=3242702 RepID=A0ABV4UBR7_9BACT
MIDNVTPGQTIRVKVVKHPTNASARKTLTRILSKDADVKREDDRLRKVRKTSAKHKQRGGRDWTSYTVKQRPVTGDIGDEGTIFASVDVIRDLGSVKRFVEVSQA